MKNTILSISLILLLFSCKKDEPVVSPDYSGRYSSSAILQGSGSSAYYIQYNALIEHSPTANSNNIALYENYRNVQSNGLVGSIIDTYTYLSPTLKMVDSKVTLNSSISARNKKGANVGNAVFDGIITYTTTDMVYRGTINGKSLILILNKLASGTVIIKSDDGW